MPEARSGIRMAPAMLPAIAVGLEAYGRIIQILLSVCLWQFSFPVDGGDRRRTTSISAANLRVWPIEEGSKRRVWEARWALAGNSHNIQAGGFMKILKAARRQLDFLEY